MQTEAEERINFLNTGPWIARGKRAWGAIGKRSKGSPTSNAVAKKQKELKNLLRSHWEDEIYKSEGVIRDSFDEALTLYQLYELAIETAYISVEDVRDRAHRELSDLLWSEGARRYLLYYSYSAVAYLAQRVGADLGFKEIIPLPAIRKGTEGRFASFLSQHTLWYKDKILDDWTGFLDDYLVVGDVEETDKEIFWEFLATSQKKFDDDSKLWSFVAGADRLVTQLAELADMLSDDEKPSYGMFYAYWMAKLYGYDLGKKGYFRDRKQVDWSTALIKSKRIAHQMLQVESLRKNLSEGVDPQSPIELFERRDEVVRKFWDVTRKQFETDPIQFR